MKKAYYPQPGSKKEVDANLLGPCGFYCGYCLAYKNGVCLGCRYQAEKSETSGVVEEFCDTLACATKRDSLSAQNAKSIPVTSTTQRAASSRILTSSTCGMRQGRP